MKNELTGIIPIALKTEGEEAVVVPIKYVESSGPLPPNETLGGSKPPQPQSQQDGRAAYRKACAYWAQSRG